MYRLLKICTMLVPCVLVLLFPTSVSADPGPQDPPGSPRTFIETISIDDSYVIPGDIGFCPFDISVTIAGWDRFHVRFDQAGGFVAGIEMRHIAYTFTANGKSLSDLDTGSTKVEDYVENSDGTVTAIYTLAGHASFIQEVGADVGRITFRITFDPNTGQGLDYEVLDHNGQLTGMHLSDPIPMEHFCALLAP